MKPQHHGRQVGDAGGRFELPGHRSRHGQPAVKQTVYIRPIMSRCAGYTFNGKSGIPDDLGDIYTHGGNSVVSLQNCQGSDGAKSVVGAHNSDMPRWKYRDTFDADYKAFRLLTGWSDQEIATTVDRSPHMVASYRRKGDKGSIPPEEVIRKFAVLFGHNDPFRYMDDPTWEMPWAWRPTLTCLSGRRIYSSARLEHWMGQP